jgi:hypothetical protein
VHGVGLQNAGERRTPAERAYWRVFAKSTLFFMQNYMVSVSSLRWFGYILSGLVMLAASVVGEVSESLLLD